MTQDEIDTNSHEEPEDYPFETHDQIVELFFKYINICEEYEKRPTHRKKKTMIRALIELGKLLPRRKIEIKKTHEKNLKARGTKESYKNVNLNGLRALRAKWKK